MKLIDPIPKNPTEQEIINQAVKEYNINRFVVMFSGGKDSLTTAHFLSQKLGIDIELVYCKTGIGLEENVLYVKKIARKYGWKLNIVEPLSHETYEIFVKRFGFPRAGIHNTVMGFLKYHPMRKWYREEKKSDPNSIIGLCSGRRLNESARRQRMKTNKYLMKSDYMIFISPIYYWTNEQVWNYIKKEKLELCPVYDTLHMSGDCLCGAYGNEEEYRLLEIFHDKTFKQIQELENKYYSRWGNHIKNRNNILTCKTTRQTKLMAEENLICNECIYAVSR